MFNMHVQLHKHFNVLQDKKYYNGSFDVAVFVVYCYLDRCFDCGACMLLVTGCSKKLLGFLPNLLEDVQRF